LRITAFPTAVLLVAALTLTGCSDDGPSAADNGSATASPSASGTPDASATPSQSASASATPEAGTTVDVRFTGGKVSPNGDRVEAEVGKPVTLRITADEGGEIHVHSTPEQEIEYPAGKSTRKLTIDKPGVVDVESHDLEQVIVQLEVS
jgi:hypothetical protein